MASWLHVITIATVLLCNAVISSAYKPMAVAHHLGPGSVLSDTPVGNETVSVNKTWSPNTGSIISCGAQYRSNLKVISCQDAVRQIPDDARYLRFGYNKFGRKFDFSLPSRFISYDGLCIIDIVLKDGVAAATGTYRELSLAASGLLHRCVAPHNSGGIAMGLGRNADMGLIMTSFTPNVICRRGNAPPYRKCQHLQNSIAAKDAPKSFGLDIKLPKHLYESDRQCEATIRSLGAPDISSFYEVWEAIVAVTGMCIRFGQIGTAWYRGQNKQLNIDITLQLPYQEQA